MRIYLIGLPASGKSTVGKELSKAIKYEFVDLDKYIEEKNNMTIPDMFNISEDYFRDKETEALKDMMNKDDVVISCGGGIVEKETNKEFMDGKIIFLEASLKEIEYRLNIDSNKRPLSSKYTIYELDKRRHDKYVSFMNLKVKSNIISHTVKRIRKELKI